MRLCLSSASFVSRDNEIKGLRHSDSVLTKKPEKKIKQAWNGLSRCPAEVSKKVEVLQSANESFFCRHSQSHSAQKPLSFLPEHRSGRD